MREVKAIIRPERLEDALSALHQIEELPGVTVSLVQGFGRQTGAAAGASHHGETKMIKLEIVVDDELVDDVLSAIERAARTGRAGDGKIFVSPVGEVVTIRDGRRGRTAS